MFSLNKFSNLLHYLILLLAFLASAPTNPEQRAGLEDAGYNIFRRYVGGVVSTWDILLFALLFILVFRRSIYSSSSSLLAQSTRNNTIMLYFGAFATAIAIGLLVTLFTQIDTFIAKDWFRAVTPIVYLYCIYFLVTNIITSEHMVNNVWKLMEYIAAAMVLYGFYRLYGILHGTIVTLDPGGIPIILYSEMVYFDLPIAVYFAHIFCGKQLGLVRSILLLCMIGFILASTRRMNFILLIVNILLVLLIVRSAGLVTFKQVLSRTKVPLLIIVVCVVLTLVALPELFDGIWFAIQTINMFSEIGSAYTGDYRLAQIENIFLNMSQFPVTFFTGFGIGTKWEVIAPLPSTIDEVGSYMAFDANVVSAGNNFLPFFHVPYFATFFRFGIVGCLFLLYFVRRLWIETSRLIRLLPDVNMRILVCSFLSLSLMPILTLGDSPTPTGYITLGINLGLIEAIRLSRMRSKAVSDNA